MLRVAPPSGSSRAGSVGRIGYADRPPAQSPGYWMVNDTLPALSLPAAVRCTVAVATPDVRVAGRWVRDTRLRVAVVRHGRLLERRTAASRTLCRLCPPGTDLAAPFCAAGPHIRLKLEAGRKRAPNSG